MASLSLAEANFLRDQAYPDLGSDASSVWDLRTRFSGVMSWRNRRWHGKISAVS